MLPKPLLYNAWSCSTLAAGAMESSKLGEDTLAREIEEAEQELLDARKVL